MPTACCSMIIWKIHHHSDSAEVVDINNFVPNRCGDLFRRGDHCVRPLVCAWCDDSELAHECDPKKRMPVE